MDSMISVFSLLGNKWLLISFMAPLFWALVNFIDIYFVKNIYKDEFDGAIICGFFQLIPCLLLFYVLRSDLGNFIFFEPSGSLFVSYPLLIGALGGLFATTSYFFYFKALFNRNDAAFLQIIWSLTIIMVPLLTFFLLGDALSPVKYLGMGITLLGVLALSVSKKMRDKFSFKYLYIMLLAVFLLSASMIFADITYSEFAKITSSNLGFMLGFLAFLVGAFLGGLVFIVLGRRNPIPNIKKYFLVFFLLECTSIFASFFSQRAIDIAPSVSYVATIETFVPVFIVAISLVVLFFHKYFSFLRKNSAVITEVCDNQLDGIWIKVFATAIMAVGVYIIS